VKVSVFGLVTAGVLAIAGFGNVALAEVPPQAEKPANCLGQERSQRNTPGGDREYGGFGPAQGEFVQTMQPYGQWLQTYWMPTFCN
jgi:hypothetical protein